MISENARSAPVRDVHKDMQASFTNVLENVPDAVAVNVGACVGGVRSSVEAKIKLGKHPALLGMFPESGLGCCHRHATNRAAKECSSGQAHRSRHRTEH